MSEPQSRGGGILIVGIVLLLIFAAAFVSFAPVARCPFCPYVPPKSSCFLCDDRGRVSLYEKWRFERKLIAMPSRPPVPGR